MFILTFLAFLIFAPEIHVRLNQIGFAPGEPKTAIVFGRESLPAEFRILNVPAGSTVFTGKINPIAGSWGQFNNHGEIDFSAFTQQGSYVVEVGSTRSTQFRISRTINNEIPDQLLEFMRQQRCGYNPYVDAVCHSFDGRTAGREVYALGQAKEGVQQGNSYGAPYRYAETTGADDMEWGAAELFRATKDPRYLRDAKRYALLARDESWMGKDEAGHYQYYPFMNIGHFRLYDLVDARTKKQLANFYREQIERCLKRGETNPYRIGVPFIWCSNNLVVALATQSLLYERMTGDSRYRQFTAKQIDWLLGRNPWGVSMFTGIPADGVYPKDVHLFTNALMKKMVRGGLVDGPVYRKVFQSLRGVSIREPDPLAAFQDERAVYHDDINDYSTNEPTMDGTASAILLWALR